jgi:ubiquinone/menaquinone biosynthesis C-methylase UbiE
MVENQTPLNQSRYSSVDNYVIRFPELYQFLRYCLSSSLEKDIIDLGAGGGDPPLYLFYKYGFSTMGIEIDNFYLDLAQKFCKGRKINLNIKKGDMRKISLEENSFSFIYSIYTIFHMSKTDVKLAMDEIYRVLRPNGLCFINFVSVDDVYYGEGVDLGNNQWDQEERKGKEIVRVIHSYFEDDEVDKYFSRFKMILKEKKITMIPHRGVYLNIIAKKKEKSEM